MYASAKFHIVDMYAVGVKETTGGGTSVPFIGEIEAEGPRGEVVKICALVDDGALVCAMCTEMYEGVKHRIGGLQRSGKTLKMANGALVSSRGYWDGYVQFGGVRVRMVFEVFPSGGLWSFLFGKPLLERFAAVHDYGTDTIKIPRKDGEVMEVQNKLQTWKAWDLAWGDVRAVFLDPKTCAIPTGGQRAPPVRQVQCQAAMEESKSVNEVETQIMETHEGEIVEDASEADVVKTCKVEEAQENSTGDLPSPSREVMSVEEETDNNDTDEIFFTAPEKPITEDEEGEGTVHTGEQSKTREYLPGDISRSPQREVLNKMSPHQPRDNADHIIAKGIPKASTWHKAAQMIGQVIAGSIFVAAAQYGGVRPETNTRGTPHGDQQSPSREVPAPKGTIDDVAIADTILPENVVEAPKIFFKYGARRYYTKSENRWRAKRRRKLRKETKVVTEEEIEEDIGESCGWGAVPEWIKYNVRIHGKVVRPRKRSTREDSKGDDMESPRGEYLNQCLSCRERSLTRKQQKWKR
ncbi:hypothetical protein B0H14DRAFT_3492967 [Mycena olivaceomarginata]|nr:hypothetical protein B0H14DRAFT_3492967 [Mycena olivaceomarginata]